MIQALESFVRGTCISHLYSAFYRLCKPNMTEFQIFKTILKNDSNTQFDFPKLQKESVDVIAETFSNIIYESLKQKSSASATKRGNVLKFINKLCAIKAPHIEESAAEPFAKAAKKVYLSTSCDELQSLQNIINTEFEKNCDLKENILRFFKRKNNVQSDIGSRIESIKQLDQESLRIKYHLQPRKGISQFEVTNEVLDKVTNNLCDTSKKVVHQNEESFDFREKQVKLGYALINLNEDKAVVKKILLKLAKYEVLEGFEKNFLSSIWRLNGEKFIYYMNVISEHFFFIIEKILIDNCTKIIAMKQDVDKHLAEIQHGENFSKIRLVCSTTSFVKHKLHSLINELYILGFCNESIWKIHTFI
ncbi:unnamed protein product [Acanthoscelides obtectus]|uniref:Uncharacterized protein n=1 Tax=Acanthoscelides obtectus TaxID=200917 RepID=A0A9P0PEI1_ACAOB|nr:unnamed protein product [Acanthoscelides obtectus]CAK1664438.1 hypothetical protein AOBTE_LOCUS24259 [Acanthoscelides obtectus]